MLYTLVLWSGPYVSFGAPSLDMVRNFDGIQSDLHLNFP
jgi:hypothetical protein